MSKAKAENRQWYKQPLFLSAVLVVAFAATILVTYLLVDIFQKKQ